MVVRCVGYDGNVDILEDLTSERSSFCRQCSEVKEIWTMEMALDPNDLTMVMWLFNHI